MGASVSQAVRDALWPLAFPPTPAQLSLDNRRMKPGYVTLAVAVTLCIALAPRSAARAAGSETESGEALFARRIAPLLEEKCLACHGRDAEDIKGGLDLRSLATTVQGGDSAQPAIVAGMPEASPLYLASTRAAEDFSPMPPKEADRLSDQQLDWLREWIAQGAPWPDAARMAELKKLSADKWAAEDGVEIKTSGGLSPAWSSRRYSPQALWAYQPLKKPPVEHSGAAAIDELLAGRMPEGITPAPAADARTFLRRATFDLIGLPPTPEELVAFEIEWDKDADRATERLVERLLDSPHYGERMAQHWLDVVRYADSSGFANDYVRGNAWRYRDYVVRSFNSDKPYDQFVREQIAGDQLDPSDPEMVIATGFLRMGPWELTGMEVAKVARQRFLDDVTNSVGETFHAHSLQCARCHDHKFDPVPTRDYYSIQAVFATTQLVERRAEFLPAENTSGFEEKATLEAMRAGYIQTLEELDEVLLANAQQWFVDQGKDPAQWDAAVARARSADRNTGDSRGSPRRDFVGVFAAVRNSLLKQGLSEDEFPPKLVGFTPQQYGNERVARKGLERLRWEMDRYEPYALAVCDGRTPDVKSVNAPTRMSASRLKEGELEETCILAGGDPFSPTERVRPGGLSVLTEAPGSALAEIAFADGIEGRRVPLAEWIASRENPLTARVIVNRVWLWHFGQPIAGNPNNFGSTGKPPTHPELLDWLAATFIDEGWSFKALHRLIMNSQAYRRSAEQPQRTLLAEKDPGGVSYAVFQPRRLSAEELRDAMLAATGELNRTLGGIPNRPEINLEAALQPRQVMGTFASAWTPNPLPAQRHRRSLYALKLRGLSDPAMEVFNAPSPDFSCERRETSNVTPQVFSLFNSQASYARALALAARASREAPQDEAAVKRCFELCLGRQPSDRELAACLQHWRDMESVEAERKIAPITPPLEVLREAVEENTGEKFSFRETLSDYARFVPDLQPEDVPPRVRGLANVCLVLFNANEFVYVY
jgi:cytochrome c553